MSLKALPIWGVLVPSQLGVSDSGRIRTGSGLNWRIGRKWECLGSSVAQRGKTPVEDEKPLAPALTGGTDPTRITESTGFHKDLNSLPSELILCPFVLLIIYSLFMCKDSILSSSGYRFN